MENNKSINNYIPHEVLKFLDKGVKESVQKKKPLLDCIKAPRTTPHKAVVFFADVSGFTSLTEKLSGNINNKNCFYGTDLLAHNLNKYMTMLIGEITRKGADIIKFAGDSIIAIFPDKPSKKVLVNKKTLPETGSSTSLLFRKKKRTQSVSSVIESDEITTSAAVAVFLAVLIQEGQLTNKFSVHLPLPAEPSGMVNVNQDRLFNLQKEIELKVKIGISIGEISLAHIGGASDKVMSRRVEYVAVGQPLQDAFECEGECLPGEIYVTADVKTLTEQFYHSHGGTISSSKRYTKKAVKIKGLSFKRHKDRHKDIYKAVSNGIMNDPRLNGVTRPAFTVLDSVLWSYVPLTAKPYLQMNLADSENWVNEFRKVTTIFCQLGFEKKVTDEMGSNTEQLVFFNTVFAQIQNAIYLYEGQINKFLIDDKGNTLIIVFGLCPFTHDDDEARAVMCATKIVEVCWASNLWTAIGVSTGMVYCGLFGSKKRKEYTVLGDAVNIAARLMVQVLYDIGLETRKPPPDPSQETSKTKKNNKNSKKPAVDITELPPMDKAGPMYIDQTTMEALENTFVPTQFVGRPKLVKVKGKSVRLQIFYYSQRLTKVVLELMNNKSKEEVYCECVQDNKSLLNIYRMPLNFRFKDLMARANLADDMELMWIRSSSANLRVRVNQEELLSEMVRQVNKPLLRFTPVKKSPEAAPVRLLNDASYKADLVPLPKPDVWPQRVLEQDGELFLEDPDTNKKYNSIWYECEDAFSVIKKLSSHKKDLRNGLKIFCLESGYGIGKTFAMEEGFRQEDSEKKDYIVVQVYASLQKMINSQTKPLREIFELVEKLIEEYRKENDGPQSVSDIVLDAFKAGLSKYSASEEDDELAPVESKLWLLNRFLGTNFEQGKENILTTRRFVQQDQELVACATDMTRMFMLDELLIEISGEDNVDSSGILIAASDHLSVQHLCSILSCLLAGFSSLFDRPIVTLFANANTMCSFSWYLLKNLCSAWNTSNLTFVISLRVLTSFGNLQNHNDKPIAFPVSSTDLTIKLLDSIKTSSTGIQEQKELTQKPNFARRYSVNRMRGSISYKQSISKANANLDGNLPYPIAKQDLHNNYLQLRIRAYPQVSFIEVRSRSGYTEKIAKNILQANVLDPKLKQILEVRTGGNATYVRESLNYLIQSGTMAVNICEKNKNHREATFDGVKFREILNDVPIKIESYCSMIFDQVDIDAQMVLKLAAFLVTRLQNEDLTFEIATVVLVLQKLSVIADNAMLQKFAMVVLSQLINSNILLFVPKAGVKYKKRTDIPLRFAEDWLRMCIFRKLTNDQRIKFQQQLY